MPQILETPYGEIEFGDDVSSEDMQSIYEKNLPELKKQQVQEIPPPDLSKTFLKPPGFIAPPEENESAFEARKKRAMEFMAGGGVEPVNMWEQASKSILPSNADDIEQQLKTSPAAAALYLIPGGSKIRRGIAEGIKDYVIDPATSPLGITTFGAGPMLGAFPKVAKLAVPAMKIGFGILGAKALPEAAEEVGVGILTGDVQRAVKGATGVAATVPMVTHGVKGVAEAGKAIVPKVAADVETGKAALHSESQLPGTPEWMGSKEEIARKIEAIQQHINENVSPDPAALTMLEQLKAEQARLEGVPHATETQQVEGGVPGERPGVNAQRTAPEAGPSDSLQRTKEGPAQEKGPAQPEVLLSNESAAAKTQRILDAKTPEEFSALGEPTEQQIELGKSANTVEEVQRFKSEAENLSERAATLDKQAERTSKAGLPKEAMKIKNEASLLRRKANRLREAYETATEGKYAKDRDPNYKPKFTIDENGNPVRRIAPEVEAAVNEFKESFGDKEVDVVDITDTNHEHYGEPFWLDAKSNRIKINRNGINQWAERLGPEGIKRLKEYAATGLIHEGIHNKSLLAALEEGKSVNQFLEDYHDSASKIERAAAERAYYGKGGKAPSKAELGAEMLRRHVERLKGLDVTEVAQNRHKFKEWLTQKFLDYVERGVYGVRRAMMRSKSKIQRDMAMRVLDQYQNKIDSVRKAMGYPVPEEPASLRMEPKKEEKLYPAIEVGGRTFTGKSHAEALKAAQQAFMAEGNMEGAMSALEAFADDSKHVFKTEDGRTLNREQAAEAVGKTGKLQSEDLRDMGALDHVKAGEFKPTVESLRMEPKKEEPKSSSVSFSGTPDITNARANKEYGIINNINTPQWNFMFGRLGEAAKNAIERIFTGEFRMRESIARDVRTNVEDLMSSLPRNMRSRGGKAFFDVLNGKTPEQIQREWSGRKGGDKVIAAANQVKGRLEEIRTTIRDGKREAYQGYLQGMDSATLSDLYERNIGQHPGMTKAEMAESLARLDYPDDWGISDGSYLPHLFFGQYKITATIPGQEGSAFISRAKTPSEAKAKIYQLSKSNPDYANAHFTVEQDTVIPADMIRLGDKKFWSMVQRMKQASGMTAQEIKDAQKGIIGRKAAKQKWFGSLQERKGFEGYSDDFKQVMTAYLSGFHRWRELSSMQREVQPMIDQVRSEGRPLAASELESIMEYLWGKPSKSTLQFDATMRQIPLLRDYVKPLALDRWSRNIRSLASMLTLRTIRFATLNRLQPLQGLYPMVGERLLAKGKLLQHTKEGRQLLDQAGVTFDVSQFGTEGSIPSKLRRFGEKFSGERSNQELAFLTMFLHGREKGLPQAEAIKYAKLRGQLMTQFVPLMSDIPAAFRGPVGQMVFQFKRFPIKQAELMGQMIREKNIGGIARMLAIFGMIGGASFYMRQTLQNKEKQLRLRKHFKEELGDKGANLAMYGLPGLLGADFSGSLVLGDEPMGQNIYEKIGRQVTGPAPSLLYETGKGVVTSARQPTTAGEKAEAVIRRIPTLRPIAESIDLLSGDLSVKSPAGETKYERSVSDAIAGLGSFRTANDANRQLAVSGFLEISKEINQLKNDVYVALKSGGEADNQFDAIRKFNERWPEASITAEDIQRYIEYRQRESGKTSEERAVRGKYAPLLQELR